MGQQRCEQTVKVTKRGDVPVLLEQLPASGVPGHKLYFAARPDDQFCGAVGSLCDHPRG